MLKDSTISRDIVAANGHLLTHITAASTYTAAPTLPIQGFFVKGEGGRGYDALEATFFFGPAADATTVLTVKPWFFVPSFDPLGVGGAWLSGKTLSNITLPTGGTDINASVRRINAIPVAATRMYVQFLNIIGTNPVTAYCTVYGIEGMVADVAVDDVAVEVELGDVISSFADATHFVPGDFTAAFATANTVLCAGAPFGVIDEANCRVVYLLYRHAGGAWSAPFVNGIAGVSLTAAANVITLTGGGAPFLAGDEFWVGVQQRLAGSTTPGAGTGGGPYLYISPQDFTAAFLAPTQLTLTNLPYAPVIEQFVEVVVATLAGEDVHYTPENYAFAWAPGAPGTGVLTVTGAAFAAGDLGYRAILVGPDKSYDKPTDTTQVYVTNAIPAYQGFATVANVTNGVDGTFDYYVSAANFNLATLQLTLNGGSGTVRVSLFVSVQQDGTLPAACAYQDVTNTLFGYAAAGASTMWFIDEPITASYWRVRVVAATGGANDADWTILIAQSA